MQTVLLAVGAPGPSYAAALTAAGAQVEASSLPTEPARSSLDAVLDRLDGRRLVIAASTADLARVLRRLMRRDQLTTVHTAVLPLEPSNFLARYGLNTDVAKAAQIAVDGTCSVVGVLKDDSGNLVVDHAQLGPWVGSRLWVRAYVDDAQLCDGEITGLRVERSTAGQLSAVARSGRLRRTRRIEGRALQLACDPAAISSDGSARDQARQKRIWWNEPEQWLLAHP